MDGTTAFLRGAVTGSLIAGLRSSDIQVAPEVDRDNLYTSRVRITWGDRSWLVTIEEDLEPEEERRE